MKLRRIPHETVHTRLFGRFISPVVPTTVLSLLFIFFLFTETIIPNLSLEPDEFNTKEEATAVLIRGRKIQRRMNSISILPALNPPLHSTEEQSQNSLIPPDNVTEIERIEWFKSKLPEFEIFRSDNLTEKFHSRILEFLNQKCEVQFFMTWISPANSFGNREMLAAESVFKSHPQGCLVILSRTMDSDSGYRILKPLIDSGYKILAVAPDLSFLFKNTPAESWFEEMKKGEKDPGNIPLAQNLSNLMRLAVLYKYGGIYIDTDFIVLKNFTGVRNSIGAQSSDLSGNWTRLNNAVLIFDMNHPLLFKFMEEFASSFNGNKWGHNGPYLVSRVVKKVEGTPEYDDFSVLPQMAFYPVDWRNIVKWFKTPENRNESRWVEAKLRQLSGGTYGVHLWNKQSSRLAIDEGSVMGRLISDHCVVCKNIYTS